MYDLLSEVFAGKPNKEFLEKFHTEGLLGFLNEFSDCKNAIDSLFIVVNECLSDDLKIKILSTDYENLFLVPVAQTYIPPIASAFIGMENINRNLFYTVSEEISSFFNGYGIIFTNNNTSVFQPDHLSAIFAFMSFLVNLEEKNKYDVEMLKQVNKDEILFFQRYINSWIHVFFSEVLSRSQSNFYNSIILLSREFIKQETVYFKIELNKKR